ncbi:Fpg/Nei family DNA glycosylase [Gandjariella thermophila]|uniref:Formamidopyrimidine-DNA glycosylase n=1 Tax=Gandjariella thermophila TaxID=1931992 RepID=A0A4D4J6A8_9PSEU|nr:DNA-formamidopyrimidine glycosylase family protein [Gandjariella thermophila]GDY32255.1 formamidopyrimidine-DNA glycosylase [Gandjariella thermophila]
MPELPDVEGFRRVLAEHAVDARVRGVDVTDTGVLRGTTPAALDRALAGQRFTEPRRHGKWLLAGTGGPTVVMHFGMTGSLLWCAGDEPRHPHDRVIFRLDRGELRFRDSRKLQGIRLAENDDAVDRLLADTGPDALSIGRGEFDALLTGARRRIKALLTDQSALAGLGNLLADELLWRVGVHPARPAGELSEDERARLYDEMRRVLRAAVRAGRVPPREGWLTGVRDERDAPCPRCGGPLERTRTAGRSTVWCPRCQPR